MTDRLPHTRAAIAQLDPDDADRIRRALEVDLDDLVDDVELLAPGDVPIVATYSLALATIAQEIRNAAPWLHGPTDVVTGVACVRALLGQIGEVVTDRRTLQALRRVAAERDRQRQLGWTRDHDLEHGPGHLYALALERFDLSGPAPSVDELTEAIALLVAALELFTRTPEEIRDAGGSMADVWDALHRDGRLDPLELPDSPEPTP